MIGTPTYQLIDSFRVAAPLERTWEFFSDARNLARITPPSMGFEILSVVSPSTEARDVESAEKDTALGRRRNETSLGRIQLCEGAEIQYRIRILGLPIRWRTLITAWRPPQEFEDVQLAGPYAQWHHRHTFTAAENGTDCADRVLYRLPGGVLGPIAHGLFVRRQLLDVFRFRRKAIADVLAPVTATQPDAQITRL